MYSLPNASTAFAMHTTAFGVAIKDGGKVMLEFAYACVRVVHIQFKSYVFKPSLRGGKDLLFKKLQFNSIQFYSTHTNITEKVA